MQFLNLKLKTLYFCKKKQAKWMVWESYLHFGFRRVFRGYVSYIGTLSQQHRYDSVNQAGRRESEGNSLWGSQGGMDHFKSK